jgi:hypothetical protein
MTASGSSFPMQSVQKEPIGPLTATPRIGRNRGRSQYS